MEGTRNERSVLVAISYVIGFVTAFILFNTSNSSKTVDMTGFDQQGAVATSLPEVVTPIKDNDADYLNKPFALASSDQRNIFYCEITDETQQCSAFIYSLDTETVQKVYLDGQELIINEDIIQEVQWTESGLTIGEISSVNRAQPWKLISSDTPIDLQ